MKLLQNQLRGGVNTFGTKINGVSSAVVCANFSLALNDLNMNSGAPTLSNK